MKNTNFKNRQRGAVSVILTLLLLNVLLIMGVGISVLMLQQIQMSIQTGQSVAAFYAADAGAEKCCFQVFLKTGTGCDVPGGGSISEVLDSSLDIKYTAKYNGSDTIISVGEYGSADRALKLSW